MPFTSSPRPGQHAAKRSAKRALSHWAGHGGSGAGWRPGAGALVCMPSMSRVLQIHPQNVMETPMPTQVTRGSQKTVCLADRPAPHALGQNAASHLDLELWFKVASRRGGSGLPAEVG